MVHLVCGKVDEGNTNKRKETKSGGEIVNCEKKYVIVGAFSSVVLHHCVVGSTE